MSYKASINFLLNPAIQVEKSACASPDHVDTTFMPSPSMSLFRNLSPVMSSPTAESTHRLPLLAPFIVPSEKKLRGRDTEKNRSGMMSVAALCIDNEQECPGPPSTTVVEQPRARKTHAPSCQVDGCKNLSVSRGLCVRHGGGSKCTFAGCTKRAKLNQRCFQHGGFKMCTKLGCTKKAKRYGHCWSHGGGRICDFPECTKVSTQGGYCWAHGGGNRCKHEGCNRRSFQRCNYYCMRHAEPIACQL